MTDAPKLGFTPFSRLRGVLVVFCGENLKFGAATQRALAPSSDLVRRAAAADRFTGKNGTTLDIVAPAELKLPRLIVVGIGRDSELKRKDVVKLGGIAMGKVPGVAAEATIFAEFASGALKVDQVADLVLGARLRAYTFDRYKTKRKDDDNRPSKVEVDFACGNPAAAEKAWANAVGLADGIVIARDLVNEPANVLYPAEFARRTSSLSKLGVNVEVLDVAAMKKLGMGALLGVGQGSVHESKVVVMRWNGGKRGTAPVAFIGKGVCFDSGGISIKPASGMEDMKADMAGGAIGLVENMLDGKAQRPGDIVTTMSGQTIEVINTDAEGRLVLADVLYYVNKRFKPRFMINLATLTGAIIVALGQEYAGMFSNDDKLVERLNKAGEAIGERVWRMPLGPEYDKMIESKFADMKNTGGRWGGAITAAQLLQRFVAKTPWAHLDIAGTAMGSPQTEINKSWASGWGVRLLDHLVEEYYEK